MYGCLIKFAVECGKTQLSQELFDRTNSQHYPVDIQNYMSLIRAAGKERNAAKALSILQELKSRPNVEADLAAYVTICFDVVHRR